MSAQIQRFNPSQDQRDARGTMDPDDDGDWCIYTDHEAFTARAIDEATTELRREVEGLRRQNELATVFIAKYIAGDLIMSPRSARITTVAEFGFDTPPPPAADGGDRDG